ncbi:hypothetical protein P5G50_00575 [Leifsonia sp. F6_8S_P_1B]|uniref:Uncharacterized protein n=1 Tax=Leifsonia williamsii TaxID=3035919 RepID=A0ABT8K9D8_9MICO|nr:hypothetical protein [Leifsonia williamsii]MDN4612929.1 hypothetical protein [Leifsonia williamsii]
MRRSKMLGVIAAAAGVAGQLTGFAWADADEVTTANAIAAVQEAAPDVMADAADAPEAADVAFPVQAEHGIEMGGDADPITIGLPFAEAASDAMESDVTGVVVYDNKNGSATVPVPLEDGGVQINTVISGPDAPARYDYPIDLPEGHSMRLNDDGSVWVLDASGVPTVGIAAPWAKDATGRPVPTHFEIRQNVLAQVVDFTSGTAFPVVADPSVSYYSYNCVSPTGSSYFMKPGENLVNCKGSYLQKYISGKMVKSVGLKYNGGAKVKVTGAGWCVASLTGAVPLAFYPPTATFMWSLTAGSALLGVYGSCKGF